MLLVIRGPSGAGKTTVSRLLREKLGNTVILCPDTFYHEVFLKPTREMVYGSLETFAGHFLSLGYNVIIEGILSGYYENNFNVALEKIATTHNSKLFVFYLKGDLNELLERNRARPHLVIEEQSKWFASSIKSISNDAVLNVNEKTAEEVAVEIMNVLLQEHR